MSTIDDKYLGDRVKALEENVTDTIVEGSTAVPTSGAVYQALQGSSIRYVIPYNSASTEYGDVFFSDKQYNANPTPRPVVLYNNSFRPNYDFLWIKNSAFNIDESKGADSQFFSKFILNIIQYSQQSTTYITSINYSTVSSGYTVLNIPNANVGIMTLMLQ